MSNQAILLGSGGLIVGLLGGLAIGGDGAADLRAAVERAMGPAQEAASATAASTQEALAALGARLESLEAGMADSAPDMEGLQAALSDQVSSGMAEMREALSADIAATAKAQNDAIQAALADLSDGMAESARVAAAAVAAAAPGGGDGGGAAQTAPDSDVAVSDAVSVGKTAMFADGKVRAFVSRIDQAGGSAVLVVNGERAALGSGGSTTVSMDGSDCTLSVMALTDNGVTLASDCGAAPAAPAAAAAESSEPPENGIKPGNVAMLADGALRVFVSSVSADAARIAINGVTTQQVAAGDSVEAQSGDQSCTVTVTGVGDGMVGLEGSCG